MRLAAAPGLKMTGPGVADVVAHHRADQRVGVVAVAEALDQPAAGRMWARSSRTISRAVSLVSSVTGTSLTSAAGAWSHMPMHGVDSSVIMPSGVVWPKLMPSSSRTPGPTAALPCIRSMMSLQRRITTCPSGWLERNA